MRIPARTMALALFLALSAAPAGAQSAYFWGESDQGQSAPRSSRWIFPFFNYPNGASQAASAGRVLGMEFEATGACTAAAIAYEVGSVSGGTVRVGIYGPASTPEEMGGAALIAESGDVAQGTINTGQTVSFTTPVVLTPSTSQSRVLYYGAIIFSSGTGTFLKTITSISVTGFLPYYDRSGGYGALTNPSPSVLHNINAIHPVLKVLCQ